MVLKTPQRKRKRRSLTPRSLPSSEGHREGIRQPRVAQRIVQWEEKYGET